jgi:hypothetical protein
MAKLNIKMKDVASDGDCMFSSISLQLEKKNVKSSVRDLRIKTADYIRNNPADFEAFLETDLENYCNKVRPI